MILTDSERAKLTHYLERDVKILRQVIYKELQAWKRTMYECSPVDAPTNGDVWNELKLTEGDKAFIDEQTKWFLFGPIGDDILVPYGEATLKDLQRQKKLTIPQQQLKQDLEMALWVDKPPTEAEPFK